MKRVLLVLIGLVVAGEAWVAGQNGDAARVLAELRTALGGEAKVAAVRTLQASGKTTRVLEGQPSVSQEFELAMELPDKYVKKQVFAAMMGTTLWRSTGFNKDTLLEAMDAPPAMGNGNMRVVQSGPGGPNASPEAQAAARKATLVATRQEFARLALGMLGGSYEGMPVTFVYAGVKEAPDGKADMLDVKGPDDFVARFYVDTKTKLPLMVSWQDKEPARGQVFTRSSPGGPVTSVQGGQGMQSGVQSGAVQNSTMVTQGGQTVVSGAGMTPEELATRMREMEANRRVVEFRLYYGDYKVVDGVKLPFRMQRVVDGRPVEEMAIERYKVNPKLSSDTFTNK